MPPDCLSLGLIAGRRGLVAAVVAGQAQAHHSQLVDDLFQGFASQVAHLHHLILGLGDQVLHRVDVGALEAVEAADGQVQLFDCLLYTSPSPRD